MSTRQLVDRVIASRQSRSRVTPAQHARLPFRVKGTLMAEQHDDDLELRVMNIHGNLQPAESFLEFMRMVFVELVALNDVLFADLKLRYPDYDEWDEYDKMEAECEMFRDYSLTSRSPVRLVLEQLGVPWPLMCLLDDTAADSHLLRSLVARQRFERMWLRLVISKTSIAHLAFLFDEYCPKEDPFPRLKDLRAALGTLAHLFGEMNCSCTIDEFTVGVSPSGARGTLETCSDGVRWITGRDQQEIDEYLPSDGEMDY